MSSLESAPKAFEASTEASSSVAALAGIAFVGFLTVRDVWNLFHRKGMLSGTEGKFL